MTDKILVLTTCGSQPEAGRLAQAVVEARLAACATVVAGAESFYHWRGALERSAEWLVLIKSRRDLFAALCESLRNLHSYEVPEILALPVVEGAASYLEWMDRELAPAP